MDAGEKEKWLLAGKTGKEAREYAASLVKPGVSVLDLVRKVDEKIRELNVKPSFPVNVSINSIAAHFHPNLGNKTVFNQGDIVKIDLGTSVDGYLSDTAETVVVGGGNSDLVEASRKALDEALRILKAGMPIDEISQAIEGVIRGKGFSPIVNLGGHGIGRYDLHAPSFIPNVDQRTGKRLVEDGVIAIEPFATTGAGYVVDDPDIEIFMLQDDKPVRDPTARKVLEFVKENYNTLPFARRWIEEKFGGISNYALKLLTSAGVLYGFNVLKEASGGTVSQFEHTILFDKGEVIVTTL